MIKPEPDSIIMMKALNEVPIVNELRGHIGLSMIGSECLRHLQYQHYWCSKQKITNRIMRLFNFGHMMEDYMISDLAKLGIYVTDQQRTISATGGHWKGHTDGEAVCGGVNVLVEFKTHNLKSFNDLKKKLVLESKPGHYAQMQAYMGYTGLTKALYMAYCKDNSEYYIEIIDFNHNYFVELQRKEAEVLFSEVMLPRIGNGNPSWFKCKFCDDKDVCFGKTEVVKSCRSCDHVDIHDDGRWACTNEDGEGSMDDLSLNRQRTACSQYKLGDMFHE